MKVNTSSRVFRFIKKKRGTKGPSVWFGFTPLYAQRKMNSNGRTSISISNIESSLEDMTRRLESSSSKV